MVKIVRLVNTSVTSCSYQCVHVCVCTCGENNEDWPFFGCKAWGPLKMKDDLKAYNMHGSWDFSHMSWLQNHYPLFNFLMLLRIWNFYHGNMSRMSGIIPNRKWRKKNPLKDYLNLLKFACKLSFVPSCIVGQKRGWNDEISLPLKTWLLWKFRQLKSLVMESKGKKLCLIPH